MRLTRAQGEKVHRTIELRGQNFAIRKNLYQFLEVYRTWDGIHAEWIWIDQLCINQQSSQERGRQVALMDKIFSPASRTYIWLGPTSNDELAFRMIWQLMAGEDGSSFLSLILARNEAMGSLHALYAASYWSRLWVLQEIIFSSNRLLLRGQQVLEWRLFEDSFTLLRDNLSDLETIDGCHDSLATITRLISCTSNRFPGLTAWYNCVLFSTTSNCTDLRDKIYGVQSLYTPELHMRIDYDLSRKEVYYASVSLAVRPWLGGGSDTQKLFRLCARLAKAMGLLSCPWIRMSDRLENRLGLLDKSCSAVHEKAETLLQALRSFIDEYETS